MAKWFAADGGLEESYGFQDPSQGSHVDTPMDEMAEWPALNSDAPKLPCSIRPTSVASESCIDSAAR